MCKKAPLVIVGPFCIDKFTDASLVAFGSMNLRAFWVIFSSCQAIQRAHHLRHFALSEIRRRLLSLLELAH